MKRTALTVASTLSLAAVLTACGGGTDKDANANTDSKPDTSASPTKTLSPAEQVARLMVTTAEAPGYTVDKADTEYAMAKSQDDVTVDKTVCASLAYAMNQLPLSKPQATLTRIARADKADAVTTYVTLSTYASGAARTAMADLSKSLKPCAGGFTAKGSGGSNPYDSVTTETAPTAGDKSLAFAATFDANGNTQTVRTQVSRFGDTVVTYFSMDTAAVMGAGAGDAKVPAGLVKVQNAKLG
ncbi:hypothetical protein [Streptomyces lutosisoli]|uniref:Lipoprotein n=1 Tax=Streptomyces lutosisoli TaxID=2665721 RepID=A0ABW2VGG2_9ACTN